MRTKTNTPVKHSIITAIIMLLTFTTLTYVSCKKDKCKDVTCQNGGTCNDGTCTCATGYTGTNCETSANAVFIGNWNGVSCLGVANTMPISSGGSPNTVSMPGGAGTGSCYMPSTAIATVSGNTFTVTSSTFTDLCGKVHNFDGTTGTVNGNNIHIDIVLNHVTDGGVETGCFNGSK